VLANVMRKPMEAVFSEFAGRKPAKGGEGDTGDTYMGSGDVKYHLGTSYDRPTISGGWWREWME
jgi:2-oxoglutarate dehydrogenase E1 component